MVLAKKIITWMRSFNSEEYIFFANREEFLELAQANVRTQNQDPNHHARYTQYTQTTAQSFDQDDICHNNPKE